jgi:hypothetical protein
MNNNTATKHPSKKRKRQEKLQQYGVDLPEIPGVPVEVIPLLIHALQSCTKFFQHQALSAYNQDWENNNKEDGLALPTTSRRRATNNTALENVFSRLDDATTAHNNKSSEKLQQQKQRNEKMRDAVQSWLQAVKRNVTKAPRYYYDRDKMVTSSEPRMMREKTFYGSVPLSCFGYILTLSQDHHRLAVRRAALYMNRLLLEKDAECRRFFLEQDNHLWQWVQGLSSSSSSNSRTDHTKNDFDPTKQRLWQKEGHLLLLQLLDENYDELYPKLRVAEQYLRQSCLFLLPHHNNDCHPSSLSSMPFVDDEGTTTNMNSLRKLRDIAMEHGAEELRRIELLLQRCHNCMNVLVPRIGDDNDNASNTIKNTQTFSTTKSNPIKEAATMPATGDSLGISTDGNDNDDDDDDDDDDDNNDINWEDGWEVEEEEAIHNNDETSHAKAVERTLEAMSYMGGFRTEGLQIDFDMAAQQFDMHPTTHSAVANNSTDHEAITKARERFTKCARFLSDRHLPRIGAWLEGLAKADRLCLHSPPSPAASSNPVRSLLLMSPQQGQECDELRDKLIHIKAQVRAVLKSASQLGLCTLKA